MEAAVAALISIDAYSRAGAKIFLSSFIAIIDISSPIGVKIFFRSSLQTH